MICSFWEQTIKYFFASAKDEQKEFIEKLLKNKESVKTLYELAKINGLWSLVKLVETKRHLKDLATYLDMTDIVF